MSKNKPSKKNQKTPGTNKFIEVTNPTDGQISQTTNRESTLSSMRKRIFFVVMLLLPFIFIGTLEVGLRIFQYGPDLSLFVDKEIYGTTYKAMNPLVKARYFPKTAFSQEVTTDYFSVPKPQSTFRIFCLGGSTAAGFPYWRNVSFASFLQKRLSSISKERNIEVINLGMTAVNSYTVLDIAKELPAYEPDLIIVYDGHNEFYGGLGVASNLTISSSRWVTMIYLQAIHSKVFLLVHEIINGFKSLITGRPDKLSRNLTLELLAKDKYIPYGSELYNEAENTFKLNMNDLAAICRNNNIPLILSTQVSNLRDIPPFASVESKNLSVKNKKELIKHLELGTSAWKNNNWKEALEEFRTASKIDPQYALAHFKIADCLKMIGLKNEARNEYSQARDFDQFRFRASSGFNHLIQLMEDSTTVGVVDMEKFFIKHSPDSLSGSEIILEHVHPNSYGYFVMAVGYASVMRKRGILFSKEEWMKRDTIPDDQLWKERPLTDLDERVAARRTEILKSGQPFTKRPIPIPEIASNDTLGQIAERIVDGKWGWINAHKGVAAHYLRKKDWINLENEYKTIVNLNPFDIDPHLNLAQFYYNQKRFDDANFVLLNSLNIHPTFHAYRLLGDIASAKGDANEAIKYYLATRHFQLSSRDDVDICYQLAVVYMQMGQLQQSEKELIRLLSIEPGDEQSKSLLWKVKQMMKTL